MAGVDFRVILEDGGSQHPGSAADASTTEWQPGPPVRPPEERPQGPRADRWKGAPRDSDGGSDDGRTRGPRPKAEGERASDRTMDELKKAAVTAADSLGQGGLARAAISLSEAFHRLLAAITGSAVAGVAQGAAWSARSAKDAAAAGAAEKPATRAKPEGSRANRPDLFGVEDAEFEVKADSRRPDPPGPKIADEERGLSIPGRGPLAKPGKTTVETAGVRGPAVKPPVEGAAAGGQAAGTMARLAAAAGPAAIVVGTFAATVGIGVAILKRTFNELDRLKDNSADLSAASAEQSVRMELADLRRAQRLGPTGASAINLQTQLMEQIHDILTEFYAANLEWIDDIRPALQLGVNSFGVVVAILTQMQANLEYLKDYAANRKDLDKDLAKIAAANDKLAAALKKWTELNAPDPFGQVDPGFGMLLPQLGLQKPPARPAATGGLP